MLSGVPQDDETTRCRSTGQVSIVSAPSMIRTCDPRLRRPMLYPAELWARGSASWRSKLRPATREMAFKRVREISQATRAAPARNALPTGATGFPPGGAAPGPPVVGSRSKNARRSGGWPRERACKGSGEAKGKSQRAKGKKGKKAKEQAGQAAEEQEKAASQAAREVRKPSSPKPSTLKPNREALRQEQAGGRPVRCSPQRRPVAVGPEQASCQPVKRAGGGFGEITGARGIPPRCAGFPRAPNPWSRRQARHRCRTWVPGLNFLRAATRLRDGRPAG